MHAFRRLLFALAALLLVWSGPVPVQAGDVAQSTAADAVQYPQTNAEIRQWYNDRVAVIPLLDGQWQRQGLGAEERARRAYEIRHEARIEARAYMRNKQEVAVLRARDREKYGNPDGPTFDQLVAQNREKGLQGDAAYEAIVGSANRTDAGYNKTYGVKPASASP
ncbi:hypothetical protein [Azospirillum sp. TSO22-1]|uniref:hypothetical protein n=1 Tax=Azospirillum sp. TSO22-1 TaxID=716789 RepID=UPI000D6172E2|nr:hypothetical protein [Azospirillum sp. TSO22-1]PWC54732.1 hypothetical protein TSO221_07290 [Azospirillum sp. TSO22-1]